MSFIDHLEELRWHLIRAGLAIGVFSILAFVSKKLIFHDLILGPSRTDFWTYRMFCKLGNLMGSEALCMDKLPFVIQSRTMTGQFSMHLTTSFVVGLICAFPYAFWELWRFIRPGLYDHEKGMTTGAVFWVTLLFMTGIAFGYFIVTPISVNFLSNYQVDESILNEFDILSYVSTVTMIVLACGLMFQLPVVIYVLSKVGVVTPITLRYFRRHALVVILVVSAVITPPDVISQIMVSLPLLLLYEVGIRISAVVVRKRVEKQISALQVRDDAEVPEKTEI